MITIGSPLGATFTVEIKNQYGDTVYGPVSQTNAPFDPGITDSGDYTMTVNNNGAINGWCFSVDDTCACPVFNSAEIVVTPAGLYYADISFDMSGGFLCPFLINAYNGFGSPTININSLADFTSHTGDIYTKRIQFLPSPDFFYEVRLTDNTFCRSETIHYNCDGPHLQTGLLEQFPANSGNYRIALTFNHCGDTCHTVTVNYLQLAPIGGTLDAGSLVQTISCPAPYTFYIPVTPANTAPGATLSYKITTTDCCGTRDRVTAFYQIPN